jgi:DNA polymerase-1
MRTLLVDGDIVVYKAAFGAEQVHQFDEDEWTTTANEPEARETAVALISRLQDRTKSDEVVVALSDDRNWRKELLPTYKQQRAKVRRPILLKPLKAFIQDTFKTYIRPTLEADDVLGILATASVIKGEKVIASIDKDLLQIPGLHCNIDSLKKIVVTEEEGDLRHLTQTLTGDVVDNYPGCPGVGPVRAAKLLEAEF